MKNKLLLLTYFLISNFSFCQNKKELFYNYNLEEISKEKFISLQSDQNYTLSYEIDNSIKTYLVEMETSGELNYYLLESIKKYLNSINPKATFKNWNFIVINYIDNGPICGNVPDHSKNYQVPWDVFENDIKKSFKKSDNISHFYIMNPDVKNTYYYHSNKIKWRMDKDHFLRNKFFKFGGLNGGFLIIDKEGGYFCRKGEYSTKDVLIKLEQMKNKQN